MRSTVFLQFSCIICCITSSLGLLRPGILKRDLAYVVSDLSLRVSPHSIPHLVSSAVKQPVISAISTVSTKSATSTASTLSQGLFSRGGHLSFGDAIGSPIALALHSGRFALFQKSILKIPEMASGLWPLIRSVLNPFDLALFSVLYVTHKPLLRLLHSGTLNLRRKIYALPTNTKYPESIFGFIEKPISAALLFLPFVYSLDIISITLHQFGFDFHVKGDLSRLLCVIYEAITAGMFITKLKDYLLNLHRLKKYKQNLRLHSLNTHVRRDKVRESTVDELGSIVVWTLLSGLCLEAMSLEFGFALGSIFAVGGIGSASVVLALRSTMENVISGLLLKLEDKIRVGEIITVPGDGKKSGCEEGVVEEVNYIATTIRREDNSVVVVPNQVFSKGEIINWSRTPYRLFKTSVAVKMTDCSLLGDIINTIKSDLSRLPGIETLDRELIVSATAFKGDAVTIEIEAHLKISQAMKESELKTAVIGAIAKCIQKSFVKTL